MPPEPFPWDRKDDFIRERKHERTESFGSAPRWRNSSAAAYSSHYGSRDVARWGSPDFRRLPGHGKQGGWHLFEETPSHGCASSRSSDRMFVDETYRPSISRGDWRYGRSSRENRGAFTQRAWKSHSWETNNGSENAPGRSHDVKIDQRPVDNMPTCPSNSHSDPAKSWDQVHSKDQHCNRADGGNNGLNNTGHRCERETSMGSMEWKPLKWTRSGSLSSRGSGFSYSSSSKSIGAVDSAEPKDENLPKNALSIQSPSGNASVCAASSVPSEELTPRKKPRLGWGEGLAKFEKKKVEGTEVSANKDGPVTSANSSEAVHSRSSNLVMGFSDCPSPATPSSFACSSSPGGGNSSGKAAYVDNGISNAYCSPNLGSQNHFEGFSFNLEMLDNISIANLCSSLNELLQFSDPASMDSFVRSTAMNKLLVWKGDILKALEMTESETDLLENELKVLKSESGSSSPIAAASTSLPFESDANISKEPEAACTLITRPAPLQIESSMVEMVDKTPMGGDGLGEVHVDAKAEELDSPGTATSKLLEPISLRKNIPPSSMEGHVESSGDTVGILCVDPVPSSIEIHVSDSGDGSVPVKGENDALASGDSNLDGDDDRENMLCSNVLACNKESAREASDFFSKLLPGDFSYVDISGSSNISCWRDNPIIKQKIAAKRQSLRFKERVLTIKFKAFLNLWEEDRHLLSMRKYRAKCQKKIELGLRTPNCGYQKHRTFGRSRFSSPGGNLSLVPTTEIVNMTSKLLSDFKPKPCRNVLKMPALILEEKEKMTSRFISTNGLVEDPCAVEKEKARINPWTSEEKDIFMDKFATYRKDFRKIAAFLDHKTTADCVQFYYKYHKSDSFEKMKKLECSKQAKSTANTYLVASGKKWNREMNAASLDILGAVSMMAAHSDSTTASRSTSSVRILLGKRSDSKLSRDDGDIERSSSFDLPEKETFAADILAGISGSLSSEAMSSCITSCIDPGEGYKDWKSQRVDSARKRSSISDIMQTVDDDTCSDDSCGAMDSGDWTDEERSVFMRALSSFGKDFARISRCVRTRSQDQCRVFFSKARKRLGLDWLPLSKQVGASVSDDVNGDGSDMEDACTLETSSVVCNDKLDIKLGEDLPGSPMDTNQDACDQLGPVSQETDLNRSEEDNGRRILDQEVMKTPVLDTCETDDKPELVAEDGNVAMNGNRVESQAQSVHTEKDLVAAYIGDRRDLATALGSIVASVAPCSSSNSNFQANGTVEFAVEKFRKASEKKKHYSSETDLNDKVGEKFDMLTFDQDSTMTDANVTNKRDVDTLGFNNCGCLLEIPSEIRPAVPPLPQENSAAALKLESSGSVTFQAEEKSHKETPLTRNLEECKQGHKFVSRVDQKHLVSAHPLVNQIGSSQILRGYPLQISTEKEIDGDFIHGPLSEVVTTLKSVSGMTNPCPSQGFYFRKCNGSVPNGSVPNGSMTEKKSSPRRIHCHSLSDSEKACRNRDVKLFGKILTTTHKNEEKGTANHLPKPSGRASTLSFAGHQNVDRNQSIMNYDHGNQIGLENVPMRSYGFWDGNRIQTGFSSLPDSAILLAKYSTAIANYPASSSKMELEQQQQQQQQVLHSIVKNNEHSNLNGVSVYPHTQLCASNAVTDSHIYRNHEGARTLQPFTLRRGIMFPEMQRRNGLESMSNWGQGTAISDPVAAIRMHFAKTEQYSGQNGGVIREDEPWKGNKEIGR